MHSIAVVYELSRDYNLILNMWLDEITMPGDWRRKRDI